MYFFTYIDLFTKTLEVRLFYDEEYFLKKTWSYRKCMNFRYRTHDEGKKKSQNTMILFWAAGRKRNSRTGQNWPHMKAIHFDWLVLKKTGQQPANLAHPYRNRIANFPKKIIRSKINRNASRVNDSVPYPFPLFALLVQKSSPLPSFVRTVAFMQDLSIATSLWPKRNMIIRAIKAIPRKQKPIKSFFNLPTAYWSSMFSIHWFDNGLRYYSVELHQF